MHDEPAQDAPASFALSDGGECGVLLRDVAWSGHPLGSPEAWPQSLRTSVGLILRSAFPMFVAWGRERTFLYNDAYSVILGDKHPGAMARPFREVWAEIWTDIEPLIANAFAGRSTWMENLPLTVRRNGRDEAAWFTFSYSPLTDDDGEVAGMFCAVVETTAAVLNQRAAEEASSRAGRLAKAIASARQPMVLSDPNLPDNPLTFVNPAFCEMTGYSAEEVIGRNCRFLQGPETDPAIVAQVREAVAARREITAELLNYRKDGSTFWNQMTVSPVHDDDGRLIHFLATQLDVTARREAQEALRKSEEQARAVVAGAGDYAIFTTDATGVVTSWFEGAERVFGWTAAEAIGRPTALIFTPEDVAVGAPERELGGAARSGCANDERWHLRKDGGRVFMNGSVRPLHGEDGALRGFLKIARDETDRRLAAEQVMASEKRFREMADHAPVILWTADPDGVCTYLNQPWFDLTGQTEAEALGRGWLAATHPDDLAPTGAAFLSANAERRPFRVEYRLRQASGEYLHAIDAGQPRFSPDGEYLGMVGSVFDISDRKAVETQLQHLNARLEAEVEERTRELQATEESLRQAQKMEAIGQLTGGIAHDFNNLLTGIIGSLDLMKRRIDAGRIGEIERFMEAATTSADRAAALTHRLLAFARRQSLDTRATDVNALVASMEDLLHRTLGEQVQLQLALDSGLWLATTDENQLESALLNLAINARDAMPDGGQLTIETAATTLDEAYVRQHAGLKVGDYVVVCVTDTGSGMPADVVERAFDPFFTTKPIGQGTGLGLSMIYGFARQTGGHARIYSEVGQGTTVKLYLPRHLGEGEAVGADASVRDLSRGAGETVLVVEDEPAVRLLVVELLEELGYRVLQAHDGPAALPVLDGPERIDLMISDVGLPGLNGRQVAEAARQRRPELKVLFITGYAENAAVRSGFLAEGMEMITKPFAIDALSEKVRLMLAGD